MEWLRTAGTMPGKVTFSVSSLPGTLVLLLCAVTAVQGQLDTTPCGQKFRIATHFAPPFINVDTAICTDQKCDPTAFLPDGGMTYEFMMKHVLPQLKEQCKAAGASEKIEFEWYLPPSARTSATSSVNMVCHGGFDKNSIVPVSNFTCPSSTPGDPGEYKGTSAAGTCSSIGDATCVSPGPDVVAGAVHVLNERLTMLQFTAPYFAVSQMVVTRPNESFNAVDMILNIFRCFDTTLWVAIVLEVLVIWLMFMIIESRVNDDIGEGIDSFYDTFYWVFSGLMGGADKAPITIGGKIIFCAHAFFSVLIVATYTGSVAAFLTAQAATASVSGFESLQSGAFSTVVRGPSWDTTAATPRYLGKLVGDGGSSNSTIPSNQFKFLQSLMRASSSTSFEIFTTERMESRRPDGSAFAPKDDPCSVAGASLGAFDLVMCGDKVSQPSPDTLFFDSPSVIYELNLRKNATGKCKLVSVGTLFNPTGFGIGFPYHTNFHIPFSQAILNLTQRGVIEQYVKHYQISFDDSMCVLSEANGGLVMNIEECLGLFVITAMFFFGAVTHGLLERRAYRKKAQDDKHAEETATDLTQAKGANLLDGGGESKVRLAEDAVAVPGMVVGPEEDTSKPTVMMIRRLEEMQEQMGRLEDQSAHLSNIAMNVHATSASGYFEAGTPNPSVFGW